MHVGLDPGAGVEIVIGHRGGPDAVEPEAARGVLVGIERVHVPALLAVEQLVGLHPAGGEQVLVLLVVLELEQPLLGDRAAHHLGHLGVVAGGGGDLEALGRRVPAQRRDDLLARGGERALRNVVAQQVDCRDQRLCLQRKQAGRLGEVVAVGLGVHLDLVAVHLRVEHVAAAAEVHDVEHVDVLAQLDVGHLEAVAHRAHVQPHPLPGSVDEDPGKRDQPREPLRADRSQLPAVRVGVGSPIRLPRAPLRRRRLERLGVAVNDQPHALGGLLRELGRAQDPGPLAEP